MKRNRPMARRRRQSLWVRSQNATRKFRSRKPVIGPLVTRLLFVLTHRCVLAVFTVGVGVGVARAVHGPLREHFQSVPWLNVNDVRVSGLRCLTPNQLETLLEGVRGSNILALDLDGLVERVESHPRILRASARRDLLFRVVRVQTEERRPDALVVGQGAPEEVDADGVSLPPAEGRAPEDLVLITGVETGGKPGLQMGLKLIQALRRRDPALEFALSEIDVSRPDRPVGYTIGDEIRIDFSDRDPEGQADRLAVVLDRVDELPPVRIDLRFPGRAYVHPAEVRQQEEG